MNMCQSIVKCLLGFMLLLSSSFAQGKVEIRGTIVDPLGTEVVLQDASLFPESEAIPAAISEQGDFLVEWEIDGPRCATLSYGNQAIPLFLHPNERIDLHTRGNNFLADLEIRNESTSAQDTRALRDYLFSLPDTKELDRAALTGNLARYSRQIEKYTKESQQQWDRMRDSALHSPSLLKYLDNRVFYLKNALILESPQKMAQVNHTSISQIELPKTLIPPPTDAQLNQPELVQFPEYQQFLEAYFDYQQLLNPTPKGFTEIEGRFKPLFERLTGTAQTLQVARELADLLYAGEHEAVSRFYSDFPQLPDADRYLPYLKAVYEKRAPLARGNEPPTFSLTHPDGSVHKPVDHLGKVVYLFFWQEGMPNQKVILQDLNRLSYQMNRGDVQIWALGVGPESQFLSSNSILSSNLPVAPNSLLEAYQITDYPTCILLNRDGSIATPVAPKPGDPELGDLLDALKRGE